jgi:hypothetical protein
MVVLVARLLSMQVIKAVAIAGIAAGLVASWNLLRVGSSSARPASSAVSYYVSPGGSDAAAGTSPSTAWRTLGRASGAVLRPGDRLLLQGGHEYSGQIKIGPGEAGSAARPVVVSSYGGGRATITSSTDGVVVFDTGGVEIWNLVIKGQHAMRPADSGIQVFSDLSGRMLNHVVIGRVDVSGYGYGITIGADHDNAGFRNVRVSASSLHGNLNAGLASYGPAFNSAAPGYANADIHVSGVTAFGNHGNPANHVTNSGSGIVLSSVRSASVTRSTAYDNGGAGGATREGPIGIWAYDSAGVVLAHDVSHNNHSAISRDGGGFGLDQNTFNSVLEYNLSYANKGPGFLLYSAPSEVQRGNVVRFNISNGDGRSHRALGGLAVSGRVRNAAVYQNTVVMTRAEQQCSFKLSGPLRGVKVTNNLFVASRRGPVVLAATAMARRNVTLAGNDYYAPAGTWKVLWGKASYHSLRHWRTATRQELVHRRLTGLTLRPVFEGPTSETDGKAGFVLRPGSALRHAGLDLPRLFGLRPGPHYYSGRPYRPGRPAIGAQ